MEVNFNREDNGAVSIQVDDAPAVYHANLHDVTVKANRKTENGISIISKRLGVLMYDLSEIGDINGAPAPADRDDAIEMLANEVFTAAIV